MFQKYIPRLMQYLRVYRNDVIAMIVLAIIGIILSELPHILWFLKTGSPLILSDKDDKLYLAYAADAYFNHPFYLSDPVLKEGGDTMYPWIQFIPGVLLTKVLGLGTGYINIIWRFWAGLSISIAWFVLVRLYLKNTWLASVIVLILMTDRGMVHGTLLYRYLGDIKNILTNTPIHFPTGIEYPYFPLTQWRLITPGLSLSFLLIHIWSLRFSINRPNKARILLAGVGYGLLFYVYFYYWTTATLAMLIAMLIDFKNRKTYLLVGLLGLAVGLPSIIINASIKARTNSDWLPRTDNFLPIPHFSELMIPKIVLVLLFLSFFYVVLKRKDLVYLWALICSGVILNNHQIITGLQIQNFHWKYVYGTASSFFVLLIIVDLISSLQIPKKIVVYFLVFISSFYLITSIWLWNKASQASNFVNYNTTYHEYLKQKSSRVSLEPKSVIAGDDKFSSIGIIADNQRPLFGYTILVSPSVDNAEYNERQVLNFYLLGLDRSQLQPMMNQYITMSWGPWARDPKKRQQLLQSLAKKYDDVVSEPTKYIRKFQVKYVALPMKVPQPEYLKNGWKLLQNGPTWQIWKRL